jgi:hypothetical protein
MELPIDVRKSGCIHLGTESYNNNNNNNNNKIYMKIVNFFPPKNREIIEFTLEKKIQNFPLFFG